MMGSDRSANRTGVATAADELALGGSMTPEEIRQRRKKLMAAAGTDPLAKYGNAAFALLGNRAPNAPM